MVLILLSVVTIFNWLDSTTEMDWAWAANRLMEKVSRALLFLPFRSWAQQSLFGTELSFKKQAEDDAENLEDVPVNYLWRKRLRLTTRLIQQILPAIPAKVLKAQAASAYEGVTYNIAMFTLGDACNMASYNSRTLTDHENK